MVWDFTCVDTLAPSHLNTAVSAAGAVAAEAEEHKRQKYTSLSGTYYFVPIAVETLGAVGEEAAMFLNELSHRITRVTKDACSSQFLMQRLSVAVQRGNAACVLGTVKSSDALDELFYL